VCLNSLARFVQRRAFFAIGIEQGKRSLMRVNFTRFMNRDLDRVLFHRKQWTEYW